MALNIKTEPSEGTLNIVDLSSDTEASTEVPSMKSPNQPARPGTPPDIHCSICLEEYNNKCHPDMCWHKFCFECLKRWSFTESSCPLCKKAFKQICHSLVNEISTARYEVPQHVTQADSIGIHILETYQPRIYIRPFSQLAAYDPAIDYFNRPRISVRPLSQITEGNRVFGMELDMIMDFIHSSSNISDVGLFERSLFSRDGNYNIGSDIGARRHRRSIDPLDNSTNAGLNENAHQIRRRVYEENLWAEPLPDLSGRFRDCSASFYRENPAQTHRLHEFIIRDIAVLRSLTYLDSRVRRHRSEMSIDGITNMIMRAISLRDIRDAHLVSMLRPFIADYANHFIHELFNYANSPYDLIGYDRNVRYNPGHLRPHHATPSPDSNDYDLDFLIPLQRDLIFLDDPIEPIIVDTDDDENDDDSIIIMSSNTISPSEVIEINSSSGESDVEILSIIDTEPPDATFSIDEPSTSTGIRDSFHRPNTRYNLRRRRLFQPNRQPNCSSFTLSNESQMNAIEDRIVIDTSSDEETIETNTRGALTMRIKKPEVVVDKKKRRVKKSKLKKKKKNVVESRPEARIGFRTRSGSESSSSGDTDTNTSNNLMNIPHVCS